MKGAMRTGRRMVAGLLLAAVLTMGVAAPARAAQLEVVFKDGLWGLAIGALIGVAVVLTYKNPDDKYQQIPVDAGIGAIVGVAFGFAEISGAFATYDREHDQLAIGAPAVRYTYDEHGAKAMVDLVEARF